ncbi:MAG: SRPBCC family protein [Acidobacteria bacterium]|nr:SRPBCC family protein [Acidobacteriota bacterium]
MRLAAEEAGLINPYEETQGEESSGGGGSSQSSSSSHGVNLSEMERWASSIGGGALAVYGISRLLSNKSVTGAVLALVGGALVYRGTSGHCEMYHALGINTAGGSDNPNVSVRGGKGFKVEKSVTINKTPEELYRFWRNFENLPRFMNHLEAVHVTDVNRSHWVAKAPAGTTVAWDAEVYNEKENELIAWRSLEGADVDNAGSVRFESDPNGRGTVVRVTLKYDPPGGTIGKLVAKLFGEAPDQQVEEDLRRFKQLMEAGETPTTEGQPSGRSASAGR